MINDHDRICHEKSQVEDSMICKVCGHDNGHVWYEPVIPPAPVIIGDGAAVPNKVELVYKRWACAKCGRYHFSDGSLYSNPFKVAK